MLLVLLIMSFIFLSEFKYNQFKVNYVICLPHIGGRNFDNLILYDLGASNSE